MTLFEAAQTVSVREVAERYGMKVEKRGSRYFTNCIFHDGDRHASLMLEYDHAYCFACQTRQTAPGMVAKLEGLTRTEAARKIVADFGIAYNRRTPADRAAQEKRQQKRQEADQAKLETLRFFSGLCDAISTLKEWSAELAPENPAEEWSDAFTETVRRMAELEEIADRWLAAADQGEQTEIMNQYTKRFCNGRL